MRLDEFLLEQGIEDLRKFEDPDKPVRPFDEYEYMISLLNFVFADIPLERLTPRDRECLSEEEFHKYFDIGVLKYKCVLSKMNGDMRKCALLFFYLVLMWIEGHYTDISENMEAIKKQLASFSYALPDYSYDYKWVKVSQKEIEKIKKEIETEKACTDVEKRGKRKFISVPSNLEKGEISNAALVGECPCGEPVLAVENIEATIPLPVEIFGDGQHIILIAKGSSMIKRGIFNGDYMVVNTSATYKTGDVVIARVNREEATAKVLRKEKGKFYLEAANDELDENGEKVYKDIHPTGQWEIIGVVKHIIHNVEKSVK